MFDAQSGEAVGERFLVVPGVRRRGELAPVSVAQKAFVAGVSTREADQVVERLELRVSQR